MLSAALVAIFCLALLLFYVQSVCQSILGRQFERDYFHSVANANRLEFPFVRSALEDIDAPLDYRRARVHLQCDFLALVYLLRHAANPGARLSKQERVLTWYFRLSVRALGLAHALRLQERPLILRLTCILQFFANSLGQRLHSVSPDNLPATGYLVRI